MKSSFLQKFKKFFDSGFFLTSIRNSLFGQLFFPVIIETIFVLEKTFFFFQTSEKFLQQSMRNFFFVCEKLAFSGKHNKFSGQKFLFWVGQGSELGCCIFHYLHITRDLAFKIMLSNRYMPLIMKLISSTFAKLARLKAV